MMMVGALAILGLGVMFMKFNQAPEPPRPSPMTPSPIKTSIKTTSKS